MESIFQRDKNGKLVCGSLETFFQGEQRAKNLAEYREALSKYLRFGLYDSQGRPLNVSSRKRVVGGEVRVIEAPKMYVTEAGELVTADQLVGLQPKAPLEVFRQETPIDTGYLSFFKVIQSDAESETYDEIEHAIAFRQLVAGEKPDLQRWTGTALTLTNLHWGAAFGYSRQWVRNNRVWKLDETNQVAKEGAYEAKATYIYDLVKNAGFNDEAYATSWIASLNAAIARLRRSNALGPNQRPVVVCPVELEAEILQAIRDTQVVAARGEILTIIPDVVSTAYYASTDPVDVVAPFNSFRLQERMPLTAETDPDPIADSEAMGWFFEMNAAVLRDNAGESITH